MVTLDFYVILYKKFTLSYKLYEQASQNMVEKYLNKSTSLDPLLQEAYLAIALVNSKNFPYTFYKIDLLLEHQDGKFKCFCNNTESLLQESDELFCLHTLTMDTLQKLCHSMNKTPFEGDQETILKKTRHLTFWA